MRYGIGRVGTVRVIIGLSLLLGASSLLSPLYGVSEPHMFAIFGVFFVIYTVSSFYIPVLLKLSYKFRKKKPKHGEANSILKILLGSFDRFRVFRKSKRYNVYLKLKCRNKDGEICYEGKVLDLSARGCMAYIKDIEKLSSYVDISIYIPVHEKVQKVSVFAEHIWVSEQDGVCYHGFRFEEFAQDQERIVENYLSGLDGKVKVKPQFGGGKQEKLTK